MPEIVVHAGVELPSSAAESIACLAYGSAAGPDPALLDVPVEPGAAFVVIAYQYDRGRFGTYRLDVLPLP